MRTIVLFCAAGMSTSLLVTKMREASKKEGYDCKINAYSLDELAVEGSEADIILLGPQVRFQLKAVKEQFPDKKVSLIDRIAYGIMDGKKVLASVKLELGDE